LPVEPIAAGLSTLASGAGHFSPVVQVILTLVVGFPLGYMVVYVEPAEFPHDIHHHLLGLTSTLNSSYAIYPQLHSYYDGY
jgi:hypothetical protein